ncbi:MAG TPA: alpha/beta hydrolase [Dehalococcoidia bacterium]|nr:alpha/beta hydrolase [Dehalococcoidia bacterium]
MQEPESRYFTSQRLRLHYVVWGDEARPPLVLVHGNRDHARNWDHVARALLDEYAVYVIDLRGHGESDWAIGDQYSLPEYAADLAAFAEHLGRDPLPLIGHSLGGAVVLQYTGIFSDRVRRVAAIEGLGPGSRPHEAASLRMRRWVAQLRDFERRTPRHYLSIADAVERMRAANPRLTPDLAEHLTRHGVRRNDDGTYTWKFDNYVRLRSPYEFNIEDARELWNQIRCPVLLIRGDESRAPDPEQDGKASAFHHYRSVVVPGAGHWVHHDQPEVFLQHLRAFLAER